MAIKNYTTCFSSSSQSIYQDQLVFTEFEILRNNTVFEYIAFQKTF